MLLYSYKYTDKYFYEILVNFTYLYSFINFCINNGKCLEVLANFESGHLFNNSNSYKNFNGYINIYNFSKKI